MYVRLDGMYGGMDHSAYYRKQGSCCFDLVNDKRYASDLTEEEVSRVMEHAEWHKKQYDAQEVVVEPP